MAQFDVFRSRDGNALLLDCQSNALDHFDTCFVVPLLPVTEVPKASRLNPIFEVNGEQMVMATQLASAVDRSEIGTRTATLANQHYPIINALDMLITGY